MKTKTLNTQPFFLRYILNSCLVNSLEDARRIEHIAREPPSRIPDPWRCGVWRHLLQFVFTLPVLIAKGDAAARIGDRHANPDISQLRNIEQWHAWRHELANIGTGEQQRHGAAVRDDG